MRQDNTLAAVVGNIYDTVLDPGSWPDVLAAAAKYVGGQSAGLLSTETVGKTCTVHQHSGFDQDYVDLYRDEYWKFDPTAPSPLLPFERLTSVSDYLSDNAFREGRFCQEWLEPQGWIDGTSIVLERSATSCSTFVVARHETRGIVDDEMSMRMKLIAPHICRAVQVANAIDVSRVEAATFSEILDSLSAGIFLMDARGGILHANPAGRTMLAANDFFSTAHGRLVARDRSIDRLLRTALAAPQGDAAASGAITVPLISRDGENYIAHLLPLPAATGRRASFGSSAAAALFVHKTTVEAPSLPEEVARHYKLTATELRVLLGIVEVGGGREVAEALGVGVGTIKTHLKRLYQKTGAHRQADLVKLVAGFSSPLLS